MEANTFICEVLPARTSPNCIWTKLDVSVIKKDAILLTQLPFPPHDDFSKGADKTVIGIYLPKSRNSKLNKNYRSYQRSKPRINVISLHHLATFTQADIPKLKSGLVWVDFEFSTIPYRSFRF